MERHRLWIPPYFATPESDKTIRVHADFNPWLKVLMVVLIASIVFIDFKTWPYHGALEWSGMIICNLLIPVFIFILLHLQFPPVFVVSKTDNAFIFSRKFFKDKIIHFNDFDYIKVKTKMSTSGRGDYYTFSFQVFLLKGEKQLRLIMTYTYNSSVLGEVHMGHYKNQLANAVKMANYIGEFCEKNVIVDDPHFSFHQN